MGEIRRHYDSGSEAPDLGAIIQCVNARETMIKELLCHGIDRLCCMVYPTAHIEIHDGNIGGFVTKHLSANGWRNRTVGELSINGSVQFIGLCEMWGSRLPYIVDYRAP